MSKKQTLFILVILFSIQAKAQFWFGVKSGAQYTMQVYQEEGYTDTYDPKNIFNWHIGGVLNYTTSNKYSIHTELLYERMKRIVTREGDTDTLKSTFIYHFINAPVMFRVQFGRSPVRFYINAGPQFRFWAAAKGTIQADELIENGVDKLKVKVSFKNPGEEPADGKYFVPNPNRIQYAFLVGGGVVLDLFNKSQRLMIDGRYAFGHSIMAFNRGTEPSQLTTYFENFEFRDNTITLSLAYLFGFNPVDVRKGSSTIKQKKMK